MNSLEPGGVRTGHPLALLVRVTAWEFGLCRKQNQVICLSGPVSKWINP